MMRFWGRADMFPSLAEVTEERDLQRFPLVEMEALPGQPSLIGPTMRTFAMTGSLETVKALVLAGFGVGALLDFMLTSEEQARLVRAPIADEGACALWLVASPWRKDPALGQIAAVLARALERRLRRE
jgi:DNA-binding transcriptional LysR family regulator